MTELERISEGNFAESIIAVAQKATDFQYVTDSDSRCIGVLHHKDLKFTDMDRVNMHPRRIQQLVDVAEPDSFLALWERFKDTSSVIFAELDEGRFTAVFDYHCGIEGAMWGENRAALKLTKSAEWLKWLKHNGHRFNQIEFAEFIETASVDIVEPNAAQMIEIAHTIEAKKKVDFKSSVRLPNGEVQFTFNEIIDGMAGASGTLQIPEKFTLALRVYQGTEKYKVECWLRYRINEGKLVFFYQIIRPERIQEDAFDQVVTMIREKSEAPVYVVNAPPKPAS